MTNVLYNTQWPTNQQQQVEYIRRLEKLISQIEARKKPVMYKSNVPPNQADWETAWVNATGLPLPIPPGTKLCWYDTAKTIMWNYTTAYDLAAGTQSSGIVVRNVDQSYDRPPFRLMAYFDSATYQGLSRSGPYNGALMYSVNEPSASIYGPSFPYNMYKLVAAGLREVQIVYKLRLDSVTVTDILSLLFGPDSNTTQWQPLTNSQQGYVNLDATLAGQTRTDGTNMNLGGRSAYNSSVANGYATGVINLVHEVPAENVGAVSVDKLLFQGVHQGTRVDDALTTGKFGVEFGSFYSYGEFPPKQLMSHILGSGSGLSAQNGLFGKVWLYGLFSKNTQELVDGQFL